MSFNWVRNREIGFLVPTPVPQSYVLEPGLSYHMPLCLHQPVCKSTFSLFANILPGFTGVKLFLEMCIYTYSCRCVSIAIGGEEGDNKITGDSWEADNAIQLGSIQGAFPEPPLCRRRVQNLQGSQGLQRWMTDSFLNLFLKHSRVRDFNFLIHFKYPKCTVPLEK